MDIRGKIIAGFASILLGFLVVVSIFLWDVRNIKTLAVEIAEDHVPGVLLYLQVHDALEGMKIDVFEYLAGKSERRARFEDHYQTLKSATVTLRSMEGVSQKGQERLENMERLSETFAETVRKEIFDQYDPMVDRWAHEQASTLDSQYGKPLGYLLDRLREEVYHNALQRTSRREEVTDDLFRVRYALELVDILGDLFASLFKYLHGESGEREVFEANTKLFRGFFEQLKGLEAQPGERERVKKIQEQMEAIIAGSNEIFQKYHPESKARAIQIMGQIEGEYLGKLGETLKVAAQKEEQKVTESLTGIVERLVDSKIVALSLLMASLMAGVVIAYLAIRAFSDPLRRLILTADRIAGGEWSARAEVSGRDELGQLALSFNRMAQNNADQFWIKSKAAEFATLVQTSTSPEMFAQGVIRTLTPLLEGGHGVLYVLDEQTQRYRLLGAYGYKERKHLSNEFALGVGLVGQCALEKEPILQTHVPAGYIQINSGLGEATPLSLLVIPLLFQDQVLAVIEIASFHRFTPIQQALLAELSPTLGLGLENQNRTRRTEALLAETQAQAHEMTALAEALRTQQEALNEANRALQEKNFVLKNSEEEMKMQQGRIRSYNKALEERTELLEIQKVALEQSQQEIAKKAAQLAKASQYKSEFLANMSHELRNPLNSLLILAKQLASNEEGNLTASQVKSAQIVHKSGQDLLSLVNDILDLAKIESGKQDIHVDAVDIQGFAEQIDQMFQHTAVEKGLAWQVEIAKEVSGSIHTDGSKLGQIVKNLVSNAIKFTERGMVMVRFHPLADECLLAISVIDTGIGIPADKLALIFEAFQQADGSTTRRFGGTGLGLSISKELANLLGGDIRVKSVEGKGSTFTLCLADRRPSGVEAPTEAPLPAKPVPMVMEVKDDREAVAPQDRTILVIDDDPVFAEILCGMAHKKQFKCLIAGDGAMGLELASRYQPHGIILDLGLPGHLDGMMVMDRLKANPATRAIPVHMISGTDMSAEGLAKGAVSFLTKPVSQEQLDTVFQEVLSVADMEGRAVLIVEPETQALQALLDLVQAKTPHVTTARTGESALVLLQKQTFDCMILNPDLPDIDGCDLLERIHTESGAAKPTVIIHTDKKLSRQEDAKLRKYTDSIVVKGARSDRRLQQEVDLFLSMVEGGQERQHRQESRMAQDQEAVFAGKKILIVDDDMRSTYALASALGARGLKTEIADNGIWALKKLQEHADVHVVLMDIMMPEMDGYETIAAIRKQESFKDLPIIVITAKAMAEERAKSLQAGANDYLAKPIEMERLFSLLRVWLNG